MKAIKHLPLVLALSLLLVSCGNKKNQEANGALGTSSTDGFLPTDLASVTISAAQNNGEGFVISSIQSKNSGEPTVEDGLISFNVNYETFSGSKDGLSLKTDIFSLVANGFVQQSYSDENFSLMMSPGIYILTITISKGALKFPPFKAKMVVKCAKGIQGNTFTVDASKVKILPVADLFWSAQNRNVFFGKYQHDLSQVVTQVPQGANLNLYSYDLDTNGDGSLLMQNGSKINEVGYGIDIINRNIFTKVIDYSTFADNQRSVVYKIYDECYNSKSIEVSTGNNGVFGATEKEDVISADIMPQMKLVQPSTPEDPSYMVQNKMSFLQQAEVQINTPVNCEQRVGGVNYPQGCDPRLTGTLSLIDSYRASVICNINNGSLTIRAEEVLPGQNAGYNYNLIDKYNVNFTISNIIQKFDGNYPTWESSNAKLQNYTYTIPGAGDLAGKEVLSTNNCSIKVLLPEQSRNNTPCGSGLEGTGTFTTIQHVRVAYKCNSVSSTLGKFIKTAGELYCRNGIPSTKTDCKNNNPIPTGTPGLTPVPTSNPTSPPGEE